MQKNYLLLASLASLLLATAPRLALAQTGAVGIGTTVPNASAALDIVSSAKGLLLPRLTAAQVAAIASPATGLLLFQTDGTAGFYYNAGTPASPTWQLLGAGGGPGGAGDNLGNHTATQNLRLGSFGLLGTGASIGSAVGLGVRADGGLNLAQNELGHNLLLGYQAGQALAPDTSNFIGLFNQFIGYQSGQATTEGVQNQFSGYQSGYSNTTGNTNQFVGYQSGYSNTTGSFNQFSGYRSGYANTEGFYNQFSGYRSGRFNTTGSQNLFLGYRSGLGNTTGNNNVFVGLNGGAYNDTGSSNTALGANSGPDSSFPNLNNATALGADVTLTQSNTVVLGNNADVGIGTSTPSQKLEVAGQVFSSTGGFRFPDGTVQTTAATGGTGGGPGGAGDNLGNHTATQNLNLGSNLLVGTGGYGGTAKGLGVRADGGLDLGQNTTGNSLYLGYRAGQANTTGSYNQFVGYQSGFSNTTGSYNQFSSYLSGYSNTTGSQNQFSGHASGYSNTTGSFNLFVGAQSGQANTTGSQNQFLGYLSGYRNTTGSQNQFSGYQSGFSNTTGSNNLFLGYGSGQANTTGNNNQFIGFASGGNTTTGSANLFVGAQSGSANTTGEGNQFVGYLSGQANTTGSYNYFGGYQSGQANTTGEYNQFLGYNSGQANTTGSFNQFVGAQSGQANTTGEGNQFGGYQSGYANTTGSNNLFSGYRSGYNNTTGSGNTVLGNNSGPASGSGNLTNATALGANVSLSQSNTVVLGNNADVGIGISTPTQKLDVADGSIRIRTTGQGLIFPDGTTQTTAATDAQQLSINGSNLTLTNGGSLPLFALGDNLGNHTATQNLNLGTNALVGTIAVNLGSNLNLGNNRLVGNGSSIGLAIANGGNVGVGTNSPAAGLHIDQPEASVGNEGYGSNVGKLGVLLSGGSSGNPSIELRGDRKTPYIDFAENNSYDYTTRLISYGGALNILYGQGPNSKPANIFVVDGGIQATAVNNTSDARFKTNVRPLGGALSSVLALRGVRYEWNELGVQHGGRAGAPQVGVLAQEVEKIYPELVSTDKDGYKAVNYAQLTPVLIEALKELKAQLETLKAQAAADKAQATATLETFEARLRRLESAAGGQAQR